VRPGKSSSSTKRPAGNRHRHHARHRSLLGRHYGVDPRSVYAHIIGEHGDSEVPLWSSAIIGGVPIKANTVLESAFDPARMHRIFVEVRDATYAIIDRKGHTNTAIGAVIARLAAAILDDDKSLLTVSTRMTGEYGVREVCLGIPCVIGFEGIESKLTPRLDDDEFTGLTESVRRLRQSIEAMNLEDD
jgi:L-lactate dehydrogenase